MNIKEFFKEQKNRLVSTYQSIREFLAQEFSNTANEKTTIDYKKVDFNTDFKKALLAEKTPYIKSLLYTLAALLVIAVLWIKFSIIEEVTVGSGKVIPSTYIKSIQSLDGGVLSALYVKQGQVVHPKEILAQLSVTDFQADYLSAKNHYIALLASLARLEAEAKQQNTIHFPKELENEKELINNEAQLFESRKKELNDKLRTIQANYVIAQKQLAIMAPLAKQGIVSKMELLQLQSNLNGVKGTLEAEKNRFNKDVLTERSKTQDELKSLAERMTGLQQRILRSTIRSPVHGIVNQIEVTTLGGVIKPGGELMQIIPLGDTLLIEARVSPRDIAFIRAGQKAVVKFTAYDYSIYGGLTGKVTYISADTEMDERGNAYYLVQVRTHRSYLGSPQKPLPIIPGMLATIDIVTGEKSIADYLLKPILKARDESLRER